MASINQRATITTDPIRNFRFLVTFHPHTGTASKEDAWDPKPTLGFTSVSGLAVSTEPIPYREGGYNTTVHQIPGQSQFSPVTFQRGVMIGTSQHWNWMRMLFETIAGGAQFSSKQSFRADVEIAVLHHPVPYSTVSSTGYGQPAAGKTYSEVESVQAQDDLVVMRFLLYNAWPQSVAYSDLNSGDNALMVEQMTLVHEGLNVKWGKVNGDNSIAPAPSY